MIRVDVLQSTGCTRHAYTCNASYITLKYMTTYVITYLRARTVARTARVPAHAGARARSTVVRTRKHTFI